MDKAYDETVKVAEQFVDNYTALEIAMMLLAYMPFEDVLKELASFKEVTMMLAQEMMLEQEVA